MKIFVSKIDSASVQLIGCAKLPSFLVDFRSSTFSGIGRLVPAFDYPEDCVGREFEVEIGQGSITEFCITDPATTTSIAALAVAGSFSVHGIVSFVETAAVPIENQFFHIAVDDAIFMLSLDDTGGLRPGVGSFVAFIVHDVSFWDEAI
ncbi:MAG: hypothetical protein RL748_1418 [Pseudomonadota bacterium]|jgi:hypothetical protein